MPNRINQLFEQKNSNILSIYFTAGYPQLNDTVPMMQAIERSGADMIEIGMPFSDPLADGPVIQESSTQAIANGMSIPKLFEQLKGIRTKVNIPLILMGYINPVMQYGIEKFAADAAALGIDGVILPDLPVQEYIEEYKPIFDKYQLKNIFLITPQTSDERIKFIDANTDGFIYMVSSASTTGTKEGTADTQIGYFNRVNSLNLKNPRVIGFGIKDHDSFKKACLYAHGAIIGTAFIKAVSNDTPIESAEKFIRNVLN